MWSDPSEVAVEWEDSERGVSYCFGKICVDRFLAKFDFDLVCRAHMVVEDGYEFFNNRTLVTVFSAPNYCGEFDNKGAVMTGLWFNNLVNQDLLCSFEILKPVYGKTGKRRMTYISPQPMSHHSISPPASSPSAPSPLASMVETDAPTTTASA